MGVSLFGRDTQNDVKETLYGGLYGKDPTGKMTDKEWYDSHVQKKVDGVYLSSLDYRNHAVKNLWAKYEMLPSNSWISYSMNKLMTVIQEVYLPPKNMKGLYEYTHDKLSEYSQTINNRYLNAGKQENVRVDIQSTNNNVVPWRERYGYDATYGVGDRDAALAKKKNGQLQDGKFDTSTNIGEKNWEGLKGNKDARKEIRKSLRKQRKESKKKGTWYDYETVDSTYSTYSKTNRSAKWIETNLGDIDGRIGKYIEDKYRSTENMGDDVDTVSDIQEAGEGHDKYAKGTKYVDWDNDKQKPSYNLNKWSVLNRTNGLVDIIGRQRTDKNNASQKELKRCMFSITNLATRSSVNPIGTVMWFPPYDLNFQESVSVQWDEKTFIGRGEPIYSYVNTVRNGTLSFTLLIDHPTIINDIVKYPDNNNDDVLRFFNGGSDKPIKIGKVPDGKKNQPYIQNEYEFFKNLESKDKVAYDKIKDRLKFFHPAYHSMTPEGFNMRLNFLHQCTRQGPTKGVNGVATNSVFGRPPFCELRIGDFINTRICINSMSITYESSGGMTWDLNPEGIGVQPMLAKVSLGIHILGGQSLNGPVLALCNAVSNNFYANSGVYVSNTDHVVKESNVAFDKSELETEINYIKAQIEKLKEQQTKLENRNFDSEINEKQGVIVKKKGELAKLTDRDQIREKKKEIKTLEKGLELLKREKETKPITLEKLKNQITSLESAKKEKDKKINNY
jgi:hypothetical protein